VTESFDSAKRLATEHSLLEDTGKGDGERSPSPENGEGRLAAAFTLVRLGANAEAAREPAKRALIAKKDELEQAIDQLKYEKAGMEAADYRKQLTQLLLELEDFRDGPQQELPIPCGAHTRACRVGAPAEACCEAETTLGSARLTACATAAAPRRH
jgi:hypothetical protein